jgi:hypothetical protein
MKILVFFTLVAALQGAAFAQKTQDPDLRDKRATAVTVQPHRSHGAAATTVSARSSSTNDVAKIEQSGIKNIKPAHKASAATTSAPSAAQTGITAPNKNKPAKFSYRPPQGPTKTANGSPVATNRSPNVLHKP